MGRFLDTSKVAEVIEHLVLRGEEDKAIPGHLEVWTSVFEEKRTLNLKGLVRYYAASRRRALKSLFELLDASSIQTLLLQENDLQDDDITFLIEAMTSGDLKFLEHLDLSYNRGLTDRSLVDLVSCFVNGRAKGLRKLVLHHTGLGDETIITLAKAIGSGTLRSLEQLDLSHNWRLTDKSMVSLAASFSKMQTMHLRELLLQHTGLGDDGVIQLAEAVALGGLRSLQKLDLSSNTGDLMSLDAMNFTSESHAGQAGITDKSMICLMTSFCTGNASSLRELHLRCIGLGGHDGGSKLAYAAKPEDSNVVRQASRLMDLLSPKERKRSSGTVIKSANARSTERLGISEELTLPLPGEQSIDGVIKLAEAISSGKLKYLERLDLSNCSEVTDESMACLVASFNSGYASNLKELLLCWTRMTEDGAQKLAKAIRSGKLGSLKKLDLSYIVGLNPKSMNSLAKSFGKGQTTELKELLLDKSGLEDGGVMKLAKGIALGRLRSLEKLDLSSNAGITNKSIIGLAESIGTGHATRLKELLLRGTGLSDLGVMRLREALYSGGLGSLEKVDLSYIGGLTNKSIESLAACPRTGQAPYVSGFNELRVSGLPTQEFWIYPEMCVYAPEPLLFSPGTTTAGDCSEINIRRPALWERGHACTQTWSDKGTGVDSASEALSTARQSSGFTSSYTCLHEPDLVSPTTNQGNTLKNRWADIPAEGFPVAEELRADVQSLGFTTFDQPFDGEKILVLYDVNSTEQQVNMVCFHPKGMADLVGVGLPCSQISFSFGLETQISIQQLSTRTWKNLWLGSDKRSLETRLPILFEGKNAQISSACQVSTGSQVVPENGTEGGEEDDSDEYDGRHHFEWRPAWVRALLLHHRHRTSSDTSDAIKSSEPTKVDIQSYPRYPRRRISLHPRRRTLLYPPRRIPFYSARSISGYSGRRIPVHLRRESNGDNLSPRSNCLPRNASDAGSTKVPQQMQSKNDFPSGTSTSSFFTSTSNSSSRASVDSFLTSTASGSGRGDSSSDHPELETSFRYQDFLTEEKRLVVEIFPDNEASLHHHPGHQQDREGDWRDMEGWREMEGARARTLLKHAESQMKPKIVMEFLYDAEDIRRTIDVTFVAQYQMGDQKMMKESFGWYQDDLSISYFCEEESAAELDPEFQEILSETELTKVELTENSERTDSDTRETSRSFFSHVRGGMRFPFVLQNTSGYKREVTQGTTAGSRSGEQTVRAKSLTCLKEATVFAISDSSVQNRMKYRASLHAAALNHISKPHRWKEAERFEAYQSGMFAGVQIKVKARWTLFGDGYKPHAFKSQKTLMRYWKGSGEDAEDPCQKLQQTIGANFVVNHSFSHMAFEKWKRRRRHTWRLPGLCPVPDILGT